MKMLERDTIFTNVALTDDGDVWWEGMDGPPPKHAIDWLGRDWTPESKEKAAHPNSRFTVPTSLCPSADPKWEDPAGVPISAFVFGGRLSKTFPLIFQSFDWAHGVYLGATLGSEATAAAVNQAAIRRDPMAMLPFCGYNMADYWAHWLKVGEGLKNPPAIFRVNWFRRDNKGGFIWPGFGENMRVLKWIVDRIHGRADAVTSPFGYMPRYQDIKWDGLKFDRDAFHAVTDINREEAKREAEDQKELFARFGRRLPKEMEDQRQQLAVRAATAPETWRAE
jgi:phosphoenolpyruvate carboxykinase (GTP)